MVRQEGEGLAEGGAEEISASYEMKQYLADADEMMIEQRDDSFSDVEDRLDFREGIVKDYPKRTLMQRVANGYQGLALRLVWHEGVQATIIYNYGQSILYNFECENLPKIRTRASAKSEGIYRSKSHGEKEE